MARIGPRPVKLKGIIVLQLCILIIYSNSFDNVFSCDVGYPDIVSNANYRSGYYHHQAGQNGDSLPSLRSTILQCKALADISNRMYPAQHNLPTPTQRQPSFYFTQEQLDYVLFGFSHSGCRGTPVHALSGLKIGEISHGMVL